MKFRSLASSTALATLLGQAALAEVTPAQVWQDWQDLGTSYGQTLSPGNIDDQGDAIIITDLAIGYAENGVTASGTIPEMRFTATGDGTVEITLSDSYPLTLTLPSEETGGSPVTVSLQIDQPDLVITAAGDDVETSYDFAGPEVSVALTGIDGAPEGPVDMTAIATLTNISGKYIFAADGDKRSLNSSFAADSLSFNLSGNDPDGNLSDDGSASGPTNAVVSFSMADITGTTNGTLLDAAAMVDMAAALQAGFATDGTFSAGETSFGFEATDPTGTTKMTGTGATTALAFGLNDQNMSYSVSGTGVSTTITAPDLPLPSLTLGYAEAAFSLLVPVSPSQTPADFAFLTKLVDFTISDEVWDFFDPTRQLPRDPATLIIDTKGTATLSASIFDEDAMEAAAATPPGELNSLEVTELRARIAGADLTGSGAFTFDNTDTVTYQGMPAPTGKLDLKLTGANTLMDTLVAMGLLPEDQVMGFRMMLSMFANATAEDELTSTLEFKDKGFFANGQRLQ